MTDTGVPALPWLRFRWTGLGRGITIDPALVAIAAATLLGGLLRIAASTGDLGLDEVWSLRLVAQVHGPGEVFWGLPHDNNHLLNSTWLYLLGPDRPFWLYRLPAVVFGTLTVPALARLCWPRSAAAGVIASILGAVALPLVDFGSEARGYAGLVLATVLAFDEGDRAVDAVLSGDRTRCRHAAWRLGAAVGFGALCHLTMAYAVAVLGLAAVVRLSARTGQLRQTLAAAARIFWPSAVLSLPALAAVLAGILVRGRFTIGDAAPFSLDALLHGYGGLMLLVSGLSDEAPGILGVAGALGLLAVAACRRLVAPRSTVLGVSALLALPGVIAAARLPNVGYCRYFWVCGLVLLALMAEALGTVWRTGPAGRRRAASAVLAMATGSLVLDGLAIRDGRGGFGQMLDIMQDESDRGYASDHPVMADMLLGGAARARAGAPSAVSEAAFCAAPPDWYIAVGTFDARPDGVVTLGSNCRVTYRMREPFAASPLSGTQSTLYRKD